jgi:hypothetical protein
LVVLDFSYFGFKQDEIHEKIINEAKVGKNIHILLKYLVFIFQKNF